MNWRDTLLEKGNGSFQARLVNLIDARIKVKVPPDIDLPGGGGGSPTSFPGVVNYAALPDPTTVPGQIYMVLGSQGTRWLPGPIGGTYYAKGLYYSNGTTWSYLGDYPWQAVQSDVNAEAISDQFVTPSTLGGWWTQKAVPISKVTNLQTALNTIPANTSQLTNDSSFITSDDALLLSIAY